MQSSVLGGRPVNRTRRTWSNNGVQYTVETSNFVGPGFSFSTESGFAGGTLPSRGGGLLGLLGNFLSGQQQRPTQSNVRRGSLREPCVTDTDEEDYESDESEEYQDQSSRHRTPFSHFAGKVRASQKPQRASESRERSPARRPSISRSNRRTSSYRTEERRPSQRSAGTGSSDEEFDDESWEDGLRQRRTSRKQAEVLLALEDAVEHHRSEARYCRKRIDKVLHQRTVDVNHLEVLEKELRGHERAEDRARKALQEARKVEIPPTEPSRSAPRRPCSSRTNTASARSEGTSQFNDFDAFFAHRRPTHPFFDNNFNSFAQFGGLPFSFEHLFRDLGVGPPPTSSVSPDDLFREFFGTAPGTSQNRGTRTTPTGRPSHIPQTPTFTTFPTAPPTPPKSLLTPEEAKKLYLLYNARWNELSPTDPNIPFPARQFDAAALTRRSSLWAPNVSSSISSWSDETVMQANVQAFFLGAAGLNPQYSESPGTGKVQMSYDKRKANAAQVEELVGVLKKEKIRWHSDRLGRRNGGGAIGPNEQLQRDDRARAVFHAVCELMDVAQ